MDKKSRKNRYEEKWRVSEGKGPRTPSAILLTDPTYVLMVDIEDPIEKKRLDNEGLIWIVCCLLVVLLFYVTVRNTTNK